HVPAGGWRSLALALADRTRRRGDGVPVPVSARAGCPDRQHLPPRIRHLRLESERAMNLELGGKVAIVTGSSRGLGLASARALNAEGARVVLCARTVGPLAAAAASLPRPDDAVAVMADVST